MTAAPIFTTFRYYGGTTFTSEPIVVNNPDGTPIDLTDWLGELRIWREDGDPATPLYLLGNDTGQEGLVIDGPNGSITATIPASDTTVALDVDGEMWPFKLTLTNPNATPDATVERLMQGYVVALR